MRTTLDFSPLFRSSIGFDRMLNAFEAASRIEQTDNWPPHDIAKTGENDYRISMAVAGFSLDELAITQDRTCSSSPASAASMATRCSCTGAQVRAPLRTSRPCQGRRRTSRQGLLTIDLKRELPEEMKPRKIVIATDAALPEVEAKTIEAKKQAA